MKSSYKKIHFLAGSPSKIRFAYCGHPKIIGEGAKDVSRQELESQMREQLQQQFAQQGQQFEKICDKIQKTYHNFIEDFQNQLPDCLIRLLELLLPKIKIERETFLELVQQMLQPNLSEGPLTLYISRNDQPVVDDLKQYFTHQYPQLKISTDPSLQAGDMILKTDFGTLDNRLKSRLKTLQACFDQL